MSSETIERRRLAAIMFTDMVGFSKRAQENEIVALELLRTSQRLQREHFALFHGHEVKSTGDGFLAEFPSALQATQCAIAFQSALHQHNTTQPASHAFQVRIGIHVGEVVQRDSDIYGDGVNIAARIEPLAVGGGICLSETVYAQVHNKLEAELAPLDSPKLKNIDVPLGVYQVLLPWQEPLPADPVKPSPSRRKLLSLGAVAVSMLGGAGWLVTRRTDPVKTQQASMGEPPDQKSVAVLPFVNMSADKSDEYLSDGMTEELLNALAKVPNLRVPGRTSCFAFKGKSGEAIFRDVGEKLHVRFVLEGSVRKAGKQLRITAQLIKAADGFHVWSETYDREMTNVLTIQSEIAGKVVTALKGKLGVDDAQQLAKKPTESPAAYDLYLNGHHAFLKNTEAGWKEARRYFEQAIQRDPSYALAYTGLADTYSWAGIALVPSGEAWAKAKELAQKALTLDPNLADAHLSLGIVLASTFDWSEAEKALRRAIALNPNLAFAYDQLGWVKTVCGDFEEGLSLIQKATELDPLSALFHADYAFYLEYARRYDEMILQAKKALTIDPNFAFAYHLLGWAEVWKGNPAAGIVHFEKARALDTQPQFLTDLGYAYARIGERAKAEQVLRDLETQSQTRFVAPGLRAMIYLGLGEKKKALDWLERSYDQQDGSCGNFKVDPLFDSIRKEPRFQALLKKINFPE
jgi:adenylate cyclase